MAMRTDQTRQIVYMAHPVRPDTERGETIESNLAMAKLWLKKLTIKHPDLVFIAPWITMCELFDDSQEEERRKGLAHCFVVVQRCDQFWMVGPRVSGGMRQESKIAADGGLVVVDYTGWDFGG